MGASLIRALFGLGLFSDVRLSVIGNVLVVAVQERPTIASVEFAGNKEFTDESLQTALRDSGLAAGRSYDKAVLDQAEQEIKRQYINRSLYGAEVISTVTPMENNRVKLVFNISEGRAARIKRMQIVGNKAYGRSTLLSQFSLDTGGWLSWYTKSNQYARTKLNADLEALRSYYTSRGYLDFKIDSTEVALDPDKEALDITITITEGNRYVISDISLQGNYLGKDNEFKSLISIKPGQAYNAEQVTQTTKAFTDYFGNFGYAFAAVEAVPQIDRANNQASIVLRADPGQRAYVRRINITGNTRTRDQVIRREFRQFESSWYDASKIKLSRDRVDRLGYFTDLSVTSSEVPGAPDQVDLNVEVKEKPTGNISIGAGYSSDEKLMFMFGFSQENVFGSGNRLDIQGQTGRYNNSVTIATTDPYFTIDGISRTLEAYYKTQKPYTNQGGDYELRTVGAGLRFGLPVTELDTVYLGMNGENTGIKTGTNIPAAYLVYADRYGLSSTNFPFTLGWSRDSRDSALAPTSGRYQRLMGELSVVGKAHYFKGNYQYQQYVPLGKRYTLAFNGELGYGHGLGGQPFPVFKNFYSGGLGSVRGFQQSTLGPRDITGAFVGGTRKVTLNTEFITPFPGAGNDRTLRLFAFVDAGGLYGDTDTISFSSMRTSTGMGLSWISPLGPLRFALAFPLKKKASDRIERFQFQVGTTF
jgi:outer membrane protein insertion porin family